jgi:hypothetical protein
VPLLAQSQICAVVTVAADGNQPPALQQFPAVEVLDLQLSVALTGLTGDHLLELQLLTPNGHLYQELTAPISVATKEGGRSTKMVPGYPDPLPVQYLTRALEEEAAASSAIMTLPVAGTSIISGSLYGAWEVVPLVDGQPAGCGQQYLFTLLSPTRITLFEDDFESGGTSAWAATVS